MVGFIYLLKKIYIKKKKEKKEVTLEIFEVKMYYPNVIFVCAHQNALACCQNHRLKPEGKIVKSCESIMGYPWHHVE